MRIVDRRSGVVGVFAIDLCRLNRGWRDHCVLFFVLLLPGIGNNLRFRTTAKMESDLFIYQRAGAGFSHGG